MNQNRRRISACPRCDTPLQVTELTCTACEMRLQGMFPPPPLARLSPEHQAFIETFVRCRGVIRDVERALGISYPTVRARLDAAVEALENLLAADQLPARSHAERERLRRRVLEQVEEGLLSPEEATDYLRHL